MSSKVVIKEFPIEEEYKKSNGITPEDISKLRDWLRTQPHLPAEHITDLDLILAYNCCERSVEVSKQLLDLHYTLKTLFTSYFQNRVVDDKITRVLNTLYNPFHFQVRSLMRTLNITAWRLRFFLITPLPIRTKEGYAVLFACFLEKDTKNFNLVDVVKTVIMILDLWQYEEGSWPGFVIVFDLKNVSLGHIAKFDLQNVSQYLYYLQNGLLANLRGVHYLNAPSFMDRFMMVIRPFMKNTLLDVLHIHQVGANTLEPFYPVEALPKESGGKYKSVDELKAAMLSKLQASQAFFDEESKKRVMEAMRPGKPKTITDIFGGIEGSFKKLEVD